MDDKNANDASEEEGCIADSASDHEDVLVLPPPPPTQSRRSHNRNKRKRPEPIITNKQITMLYNNRLPEHSPPSTMEQAQPPAMPSCPGEAPSTQAYPTPMLQPTYIVPSSQYPGMMIMMMPQQMVAQGAYQYAAPAAQQPLYIQPPGMAQGGVYAASSQFPLSPPSMMLPPSLPFHSATPCFYPQHEMGLASQPTSGQCRSDQMDLTAQSHLPQSPQVFMQMPMSMPNQGMSFGATPVPPQSFQATGMQQPPPSFAQGPPQMMHGGDIYLRAPDAPPTQIMHTTPIATTQIEYHGQRAAQQQQRGAQQQQRAAQQQRAEGTSKEPPPPLSNYQTSAPAEKVCPVPPPQAFQQRAARAHGQFKGQRSGGPDGSRTESPPAAGNAHNRSDHETQADAGNGARTIHAPLPPPAEVHCVPPPPTGPEKRSETHCVQCDRDFRTKSQYEIHVNEDHEMCDEEDCEWSGPPALLAVHKISHVTDEKGKLLSESKEETQLWLEARARARAARRGEQSAKEGGPVSALEKYLRSSVIGGRGTAPAMRKNMSLWRKKTGLSLIPAVGRYIKHFEGKRLEAMKGPSTGKSGDKIRLFEEFPICEAFLRHRSCRYGKECRQSHDVKAYQDWQVNRLKSGIKLKQRALSVSSILYELLYSDVAAYEDTLLKCLRAVHDNNFWLADEQACNNNL